MNLGDRPTDILPSHGEQLAIPQQGQDHVGVRQLKCRRGRTTGANSFSVFRVFGSDKQVLMRGDQIMKQADSFLKGYWMVRLPMIPPGRFNVCLVDQIYETQKISRVFGQYGNAFSEVQNQPGRSRGQVFKGNESDRGGREVQADRPCHCPTTCAENVHAQGAVWIDELQHGLAWRIKWMDMPELEIIRQSLGDTIEGVDNEVEIIQSANCGLASQADAVILKGHSSCERPAANVMPGEFSKRTKRPILVGNRQKLLDYRGAYGQAQGCFPHGVVRRWEDTMRRSLAGRHDNESSTHIQQSMD